MDIKNMLLGVDTTNEVFNLWYELIFLRQCLNQVLQQNGLTLSEGTIENCRLNAQIEVQQKFPVCKLDFREPTPEMIAQRNQQHEALRKFNNVMGGLIGPKNENPPENELPQVEGQT